MNVNEDYFEAEVAGSKNSELESDFQALALETGHPSEHPIYRLQYTWEGKESQSMEDDEMEDHEIWCVKYSPSGQSIAGAGNGKIMVWDAAGKLESKLDFNDDDSPITEVDWSKDGSLLLSTNHCLKLWNVNTEKCVKTYEDEVHVFSAKFSRDDSLILSGEDDGVARIWNAETGVCLHTFLSSVAPIVAVDFHHDGTRFMTTSSDGHCYVYDLRSMAIVEDFTAEHRTIKSAKFSPDPRYILFSMEDCSLRLYDMRKQKVAGIYKGNHHTAANSNFLLTTSGKHIVSGSCDSSICTWDVNTQELELLEGHSDVVDCVDCHPENDTIVSGSRDNSIKIWKSS